MSTTNPISNEPISSDPSESKPSLGEGEDLSPPKFQLSRLRDQPTLEVLERDLEQLGQLSEDEQRVTAKLSFVAGLFIPLAVTWFTTTILEHKEVHAAITVVCAFATLASAWDLWGIRKRRPKLMDSIRQHSRRSGPPTSK